MNILYDISSVEFFYPELSSHSDSLILDYLGVKF